MHRTASHQTRQSCLRTWAAAAVTAACVAGCGGTTSTGYVVDYGYEEAYLYDAYYPVDMSYAGYYYATPWDYSYYYYNKVNSAFSAALTAPLATSVGSAVRALARGETLCEGQVTVTPKMAAPACAGADAAAVRNGVTIVFNGCQLSSGGTLSGTFDVVSQSAASEQTCTASTTIMLGHTTTITDLAYTGPDGRKIVIPTQTDRAMTTYKFGQHPLNVIIDSTGQLQIFAKGGALVSDHKHSGTRTLAFPSSNAYTVDGTITVEDQRVSGTATLALSGLMRSAGCCRPTGGTVVVSRTGGAAPGQHTWEFSSSCGSATLDGSAANLPACL
jgi:hypothetical protein